MTLLRPARLRGGLAVAVALALLLFAPPARAQARETPQEILSFGLNAFRDGLYEPAAEALARYIELRREGQEAAAARYFLAEALRRGGKSPEAAAAYRDFLARHKGDERADEARFRLGELLEKAGDRAGAARAYGSVEGSLRAEALHRIAALHLAAREWMGAAEALEAFLRLAPNDPRREAALYERAASLDRLSRFPEAEAAYQEALGRFPDSPRGLAARRRLGLIQLERGRFAAAEASFSVLLMRAPAEGRRPEVRLGLASSLFGQGRYERAAAAFEGALSLALSEEERRAAERGAAAAWWRAGRHDQAARAYRRLLREPQKEGEALSRFIQSLDRSGGCAGSGGRESLRLALDAAGKGAELSLRDRLRLGECLRRAGMAEEASAQLEMVSRSSRGGLEGVWAGLRQAEILEAAGRRKEALARYESALEAARGVKGAPSDPDARRLVTAVHQGALRAAALHFEAGDCPAALRLLKGVPHESVPEASRAEVASMRAECAMQGGNWEEAEVYFGQVLLGGRRPELAARARLQLAAIAEARGDKKGALSRLKEALPLLPAEMGREARLKAGQLMRELGDAPSARAMLLPFARDEKADPERRRGVWLLLAREAARAGRWEEAEEALSRWDALSPPDPGEGLRLWAGVRFRAGRCPAAVGVAQRALAAGPGTAGRLELKRIVTACLLRAERFAEAVPLLEEILRLEPGAADAAFELGGALERSREAPRAARVYAEFLLRFAQDPRAAEAALRLGYLEAGAGRREAALEAYRAAASSGQSAIAEPARYEIARELEAGGRAGEALAAYAALAADDPLRSKWRRAAAWRAASLLERGGEWRRALALYQRIARSGGKGEEEVLQAQARVGQIEAYLEEVRKREERMKKREPLFR